jgi:GMP synthase-like glutamine amidotransferase
MEIGWHSIEAAAAQYENPWLLDLPTRFDAFQWHAHTYSLPPGAIPLWHSQCYEQQGFAKGRILAMQFHLEVTEESIMDLSQLYADDLSHPSDCVQTAEQLTDNLRVRTTQLHQVADKIYDRWLSMAGLI